VIKWISKFNNGDHVRHVIDDSEKGIITGVLFNCEARPEYRVSNVSRSEWWHESEIIKINKKS
jgi:hypothetical protein